MWVCGKCACVSQYSWPQYLFMVCRRHVPTQGRKQHVFILEWDPDLFDKGVRGEKGICVQKRREVICVCVCERGRGRWMESGWQSLFEPRAAVEDYGPSDQNEGGNRKKEMGERARTGRCQHVSQIHWICLTSVWSQSIAWKCHDSGRAVVLMNSVNNGVILIYVDIKHHISSWQVQ